MFANETNATTTAPPVTPDFGQQPSDALVIGLSVGLTVLLILGIAWATTRIIGLKRWGYQHELKLKQLETKRAVYDAMLTQSATPG